MKNDKKSLVINLLGSPGSGKSTTAALLFGEMKKRGYSVDLVPEYAKELIWEGREATFEDEVYIFAKQNHRIFRLNGKVDFIVTDAPLLQKLYYMPKEFDFSNFVIDVVNQYENLTFFLERKGFKYETNGRHQTAEESDNVSKVMLQKLFEHEIDFERIPADEDNVEYIINFIENMERVK